MDALWRFQRTFDKNIVTFLYRFTALLPRTLSVSTIQASQQQQQQQESIENNCNNRSDNKKITIDEATIKRIENLALVGFEYEHSKRVLEEAIAFAERLRKVHIDESVRPLYSTLENDFIRLREDVARNNVNRKEILKNAAVLEEEYFVAPSKGNTDSG